MNDLTAELVGFVFDVTVKVAVHTVPAGRDVIVDVNAAVLLVSVELDTRELSRSLRTCKSRVTPAEGNLELIIIFTSCDAPNAAKIVEPGSISIEKTMFSSVTGGVVVLELPPDLLHEKRKVNRITDAIQSILLVIFYSLISLSENIVLPYLSFIRLG